MEQNQKNYFTPFKLSGHAIEYTKIDKDGKMWVGNDEYESQVNYCPISGEKAPNQLEFEFHSQESNKDFYKL